MSTHSFENCNKAYNDYEVEDLLLEAENIQLSAMRKSNSKRPVPAYVNFLQQHKRKVIETTADLISQFLPKSSHFVTAKGFELKSVFDPQIRSNI